MCEVGKRVSLAEIIVKESPLVGGLLFLCQAKEFNPHFRGVCMGFESWTLQSSPMSLVSSQANAFHVLGEHGERRYPEGTLSAECQACQEPPRHREELSCEMCLGHFLEMQAGRNGQQLTSADRPIGRDRGLFDWPLTLAMILDWTYLKCWWT